MAREETYYDILGVDPHAEPETIDAGYHGRSLRFRVGLFDDRPRDPTGPTQAQVEQAYAVLRDPLARARYDAEYFPEKLMELRERRQWRALPPRFWWVSGGLVMLTLLGLVLVAIWIRPRPVPSDPVTRILTSRDDFRATITASAGQPTVTAAPTLVAAAATSVPTAPALAVDTAPSAAAPATVRATDVPQPTATGVPPTPSPVTLPSPTSTVTATPRPAPTATRAAPAFAATDRVGTEVGVNLRAGPGTTFVTQGVVAAGTLLAATGELETVDGVLWRHFRLADGRAGWMRDIDVLPAR